MSIRKTWRISIIKYEKNFHVKKIKVRHPTAADGIKGHI
jgi:hypothetical protein